MKYKIIENCSPYYIRFTHTDIDKIFEIANGVLNTNSFERVYGKEGKFTHCKMDKFTMNRLLDTTPVSKDINLYVNGMFVTYPGHYYRAHKDALNHKFSINYTVSILDDKCITSWYSDKDLEQYQMDYMGGISREASGFDKSKHTPLKSMTAVQGECVLFNTEIFHDFDNTRSTNKRAVLTLRSTTPDLFYFEDASIMLFGR